MTAVVVRMPSNKTFPYREAEYTPATDGLGVLEIREGREKDRTDRVSRYAVREWKPRGHAGRHFRLTKSGGQEWYDVAVCGYRSVCDCRGFVRSLEGECKHTLALLSLQESGHL